MSNPFADVQRAMSLYGLSTFYILGTVGNLLLVCILMQQTHRRNSCSLYLLSATVVNFILIQCILPVAIYSANNTDPQTTSLTWCKTRSYLFNALLMLYRWYKMAACVDRAAMCSQRASVRTFSEARTARRVILLITIVWLLIPIHLAVFYRIESGRCVPQSGTYAKFFSVYSIFISGWSPPAVMAIFGIIAYRNLKQVIRSTFVKCAYPVIISDQRTSWTEQCGRERASCWWFAKNPSTHRSTWSATDAVADVWSSSLHLHESVILNQHHLFRHHCRSS